MLNTAKLAEAFAADLGTERWMISYDDSIVSVKHLRPTTVVSGIEIGSAITLYTISGQFTSKVNCETYDSVKTTISDLVELAIEHHSLMCRRLSKFSEDLG